MAKWVLRNDCYVPTKVGLVHFKAGRVVDDELLDFPLSNFQAAGASLVPVGDAATDALAALTLKAGMLGRDPNTDPNAPVWPPADTAVPSTRLVSAGDGLTGGGSLAADRTLSVLAADGTIVVTPAGVALGAIPLDPGGSIVSGVAGLKVGALPLDPDGSVAQSGAGLQVGILATDVQHGSRGGAALHATATGSAAGFMSATDKTNLDATVSGLAVVAGAVLAPVLTTAALAALANPGRVAFTSVLSRSLVFMFDPQSLLTADAQFVVAPPSGAGKWVAMTWGSEGSLRQVAWYLDPVSGSDENDGATLVTPVKTAREIAYRLGGRQRITLNLTLLNDVPASDPLSVLTLRSEWLQSLQATAPTITVTGQMTTVRTGTVTTAAAPSGNVGAFLQDAGVASWTADVGRMVVITSGAALGAFAWVLVDTGSNTARLTWWSAGAFGGISAAPAPGDTYKVVTLTAIPSFLPARLGQERASSAGQVILTNVSFAASVQVTRNTESQVQFRGCKLAAAIFQGGRVFLDGCFWTSMSAIGSDSWVVANQSGCVGTAGNTLYSAGAGGTLTGFTAQGTGLTFLTNANCVTNSCYIFDTTGTGLTVSQGAYVEAGTALAGSGNTLGANVLRNGRLRIIAGFTPTLTGTTELNVESASTSIPPLVAGAAVPAAATCNTWATWSGGSFAKFVMNYKTGSCIFGS